MAVRRESVRLELEDHFSTRLVQAAAKVALLRRELDSLSGQSVRVGTSAQRVAGDVDKVGTSAARTDRSINQLTGRLRLLADAAAILGPGLVPIGAVAVPAVAGLASQLGFAAIGMGAVVAASQGVGDAFEAVVEADLEPTVENLDKARAAMERLAPEAQSFVTALNDARPMFAQFRDSAAAGLFPGVTSTIRDLEQVSDLVGEIFGGVGGAAGGLAGGAGDWLSGDEGREFLTFIRDEAPRALAELGQTIGSFSQGLAELWMAFAPMNRDFSSWMLDVAQSFDQWATGLSQTQGFAEFIDYVRTNGPIVAESMKDLGNAMLQIAEAAAPLGGPVLRALGSMADVIATIADSDLGTPIMAGVAALSLYNRTLAITARLQASSLASGGGFLAGMAAGPKGAAGGIRALRTDVSAMGKEFDRASRSSSVLMSGLSNTSGAAQRTRSSLASLGKSAAVVGGIGLAATGAADGLGMTNTATLGLIGTMGGPLGIAVGAGAGAFLDLKAAGDDAHDSLVALNAAVDSGDLDQITAAISRQEKALADYRDVEFTSPGDILESVGSAFGDVMRGDFTNTIGQQEKALRDAAKAAAELKAAQAQAAEDQRFKAMLQEQAAALRANRAAARGTAREFVGLGDSLNDAEVSLGGWIKDMQQSAADLRNFRRNAEQAAEKGLRQGLIAALQEAGPEGARRMRQLANATDAEIARANRAWQAGQREVNRYTDAVGNVPTTKATRVTAEIAEAMRNIGQVQYALQQLNGRTATTYVQTVYTASGNRFKDVPSGVPVRKATGGPVFGPGTTTSDSIPALLSNNEHVWTAREVANAGGHAAVEALRSQYRFAEGGAVLAPIGRYANGGEVRPAPMAFAQASRAVTVPAPQISLAGLTLRANVDGLGDVMFRVAEETVAADHRTRNRDTRTRTRAGL